MKYRLPIALTAILLAGCTSPGFRIHESREQARVLPATDDEHQVTRVTKWNGQLGLDYQYLETFSRELEDLGIEMAAAERHIRRKEAEQFTSEDHDMLEAMLFRYLVCREALWDMADFYDGFRDKLSGRKAQVKGFLIGYTAGLEILYCDAKLVKTFFDNPAARGKLNESYYRCNIPQGTFNRLYTYITDPDTITAFQASWLLYQEELQDPDSNLNQLIQADPEYRKLADDISRLYYHVDALTKKLVEMRTRYGMQRVKLPSRADIQAAALKSKEISDGALYGSQKSFSRVIFSILHNPTAKPISFTNEQRKQLRELLMPGDIILTYSSGYLSNIFIPGKFKHGITYIGKPGERTMASDINTQLGDLPPPRRKEARSNLAVSELSSGKRADLIEAVAEGVIFNSLDNIAGPYINRMLVLRPLLPPEQIASELATLYQFLGSKYDCKFDFVDASAQCCTELIYRALNGRGNIRLPLKKRMGRMTLSADDIIQYHFSTGPENRAFKVVLLAIEDPEGDNNEARIYTGDEANKELVTLMSE